MRGDQNSFTLVDLLLAEQQDLTPVERFARLHEITTPSPQERYRHLLPLSKPAPGEQYAFTVDLDRCSGCKACVSACHSLNGLEDNETWRTVGLIVGEHADPMAPITGTAPDAPYLQTITTACHHCVEPACLNGCPVLAYEKDPLTGIVRHLDDQCIGCQYCILKCPYDVPKYSKRKGIVRKCDMCHGRLLHGEAPACVQACPHEAIRIDVVNQKVARISASLDGARIIPGAFDSSYTVPVTRYQSNKPVPLNARPANHDALFLQAPHWPLIGMLLLTQLAGGLHLLNSIFLVAGAKALATTFSSAALVALAGGLATSVLHLGRPMKAWRAILGWRQSWMSREIIAFAIYGLFATTLFLVPISTPVAVAAASVAMIGIWSSAMIYADTRRPAWGPSIVFPRFFGTTILLGATAGAALAGWFASQYAALLATAATLIRTALFIFDSTIFWRALDDPTSAVHRAALTAANLAGPILSARASLFVISTFFSLLAIFSASPLFGLIACVSTFASQVLERWLFFTTVAAPKMPGGVSS